MIKKLLLAIVISLGISCNVFANWKVITSTNDHQSSLTMDGSLTIGVSTSNYKVNISSNGSASFGGAVISSGGFYGNGQYITNLSTGNLLDVNI